MQMFLLPLVIALVALLGDVRNAAWAGAVAPTKVSDIVSVTANGMNFSATACPFGGEFVDLGGRLVPPPKRVLMLTGFHWGAGGNPGDLFEVTLTATDDTGTDRAFVAALEGRAGGDGLFAGTQTFPVPIASLRGKRTHLCVEPTLGRGGIQNTSTPWAYGFFAPDK